MNSYEIYRRDRIEQNAPGGGVAILVRRNLVSTNTNVRFLDNHAYKEAVWCEIKLSRKSILLSSIYRVPYSSREVNNLLCDLLG